MYVEFSGNKENPNVYIKRTYRKEGGGTSTTIHLKYGKKNELLERFSGNEREMMDWLNEEVEKETKEFNENQGNISITFSQKARITKDEERSSNAGYLFLQQICTDLRLDKLCRNIKDRHKFKYDFHAVLTDLIYARILCPASKLSSYMYCNSLLEPPKSTLPNVYRALSVLAEESDYIQSELYKNSNYVHPRNDKVLYYDCTYYYFEIEEEDGIKKYGKSKEHRPNPIVTMGLFMDADGIERAEKMVTSSSKRKSKNQNDPARFIKTTSVTNDGEITEKYVRELDDERINEEAKFDGFYAVVTNLEGDISEILRINKQRWEIEENFRIMKREFEARPIYVRREDRIKAHFLTCYISLLVYRLLEKKLDNKYTCEEILKTIRGMQLTKLSNENGFIPSYKRTDLTDSLHDVFGFRTDYELITKSNMRTIIKNTKTKK